MKKSSRRFRFTSVLIIFLLVAGWFIPAGTSLADSRAQQATPNQKARALLTSLTPEERVGQLFLVTFNGIKADDSIPLYQLITQFHIGGVILLRSNNNFSDQEDILGSTLQLTSAIQKIEFDASRDAPDAAPGSPNYIPLFIGIPQEGDLYPNDQILSGLTALPNLMSIGATWDRSLAQQVGAVMGSELSALGFNFYLGPSLDVLDVLYVSGGEDLGVRTFGGDPYWVSELGKAYIAGLHEGSQNKLAVIAKHFPGQGGSDRQPETEIATIRKTFEQLKLIDLAPFFTVTNTQNEPQRIVDGLLLSHIRYQGLQRNIRQSTLPVSFDRTALSDILNLPEMVPWRQNNGLLVSDNLGSPAIRRFFDPTGNRFDARLVARDAFLAGNDLLYVDNLISSGDPDYPTTLRRTLEFFAQKYREDPSFAQRVDASVERILTLKYEIYPEFILDQVVSSDQSLDNIGKSQQLAYEVASRAVTLVSPDPEELTTVLPRPPQLNERIVFLTDSMTARQCSSCAERPSLRVDAVQAEVLRLYGPQAGGQVSRNLVSSYSFMDLWRFLNQQEDLPPIQNDLNLADWIVVSMLDHSPDRVESQALRKLLSERPDLLRNKRVVIFAFNAPYYLDATDISKVTAYYALYSKSPTSALVAAQVLFQEITPRGALPVSVPGTGYDLIRATSPDAAQVISLALDLPEPPAGEGEATLEPTPVPAFKVGDTIPLKTGVILDHNHNPVPDGTPVRFLFATGGEPGVAQTVDTVTVNGIARTSYRIERDGLLEITVTSDPAINSDKLQLDITGADAAVITAIVPTSIPTDTPSPTPTLTPTPTVTPTPEPPPPPSLMVGDWVIALAVTLGCAALGFWLGLRFFLVRWAIRWALCVVIGGLLAFNYLALDFPGSQSLISRGVTSTTVWVTLIGVAMGGLAGWGWHKLEAREIEKAREATGPKRTA